MYGIVAVVTGPVNVGLSVGISVTVSDSSIEQRLCCSCFF